MTLQSWLALALHLVAGFFYLLAGLLAPPYAVAGLVVLWLVLLWWLIRLRHERWRVMIIPGAAVAAWFTGLLVGDALFGWTA